MKVKVDVDSGVCEAVCVAVTVAVGGMRVSVGCSGSGWAASVCRAMLVRVA